MYSLAELIQRDRDVHVLVSVHAEDDADFVLWHRSHTCSCPLLTGRYDEVALGGQYCEGTRSQAPIRSR